MSPQKMMQACKRKLLAWWRGPTTPARRSSPLFGDQLEGRDVPALFLWNPTRAVVSPCC